MATVLGPKTLRKSHEPKWRRFYLLCINYTTVCNKSEEPIIINTQLRHKLYK